MSTRKTPPGASAHSGTCHKGAIRTTTGQPLSVTPSASLLQGVVVDPARGVGYGPKEVMQVSTRKTPPKTSVATEHSEQCALVALCRLHEGRHPALKNLVAIPNGGHRHKAVAAKLASEGVGAGFPDLFIAHPGSSDGVSCPGIFIEMKRVGYVPSDVKPAQREWGARLVSSGYAWRVCGGWEEAWAVVSSFLGFET